MALFLTSNSTSSLLIHRKAVYFCVLILCPVPLNFKSLIQDAFGVDFLGFILYGICTVSWVCRFVSFAKFGKISAIFLSNTLSVPFSLFLLGLQ